MAPVMLTVSPILAALCCQQMLRSWDTDGDGRLSDQEKEEAVQSIGSWLAGLAGCTHQILRAGYSDVSISTLTSSPLNCQP